MDRVTRLVAAASLAAVVGVGASACSSGDEAGDGGTGGATTSATMTTTPSSPVPGPSDTAVDVPLPVAERWAELGGVDGLLGPVTGPTTGIEGGSVTDFERGTIVLTPEGRPFVVQGEILLAYRAAGGPAGELGFPVSDETTTDGGWVSAFEGGVITYIDGVAEVDLG